MTPKSQPDAEGPFFFDDGVESAAHWSSRVLSALPSTARDPLPGISSPLRVTLDFASNSHDDAVSITMGNGRVRLAGALRPQPSGRLGLRLAWSKGFRAHGIEAGDELGDWTVVRADGRGLLLHCAALEPDRRETALPTISIVKTSGASAGDEVTARIWGEAEECRGATVRGWSRV